MAAKRKHLAERRPDYAPQSVANTVSALAVGATCYCHPGRQASVVTPCLLTLCLNLPDLEPETDQAKSWRIM